MPVSQRGSSCSVPSSSESIFVYFVRSLTLDCSLIPNFVHPTLQATSKSLLSTLLITIPTSLDRVLPLSPTVCHSLHSRTLVMSILNTTPDSFSDGGDHFSLPDALASALAHIEAGADILDIGGMSTRPGADDVDPEIEISRVIPLIRALRERGIVTPISVDTFRPAVARAAIEAGANIVNDVLGGSTEGMLEAMAELDVPVVLMHSRGTPATMSSMTTYEGGVIAGVQRELGARVEAALAKGVKRWNIILDPGVGFAKAGPDNLVLLRELPALLAGAELAGYPSLVGLSRKKFLGTLTGKSDAKERIWGTAGGVTASIVGGADIVRVHDVKEMVDVVRVADGIYRPIVSKKM
jgi:dihydroneopterin aldolase/2-amino-4-hydroxy-6-hydroxymethyldihydropteridine diphosphokinase/dihydropteroate synthase